MSGYHEFVQRQNRCVECGKWIVGRRSVLERHIRTEHPETWQRMEATRAELLGVTG